MALILRTSLLSDVATRRWIDGVTQEEVDEWLNLPRGKRQLLQERFAHLNKDDREFILTGITPDEWPDGVI
jgi:hypothetical protein